MKIDQKVFLDFVGDVKHMRAYEAHRLARSGYCGPMTIKGLCTEVCTNCKPFLAKAIEDFSNTRKPRSPNGLLIYQYKKAISAYQDAQESPEARTPSNSFGEAVERDPFMEVLRESSTKKDRE